MSSLLVYTCNDLANAVTTLVALDVVSRSEVLSNELESILRNVEAIGAVREHHPRETKGRCQVRGREAGESQNVHEGSGGRSLLAVTVDAEASATDTVSAVEEETSDLVRVSVKRDQGVRRRVLRKSRRQRELTRGS